MPGPRNQKKKKQHKKDKKTVQPPPRKESSEIDSANHDEPLPCEPPRPPPPACDVKPIEQQPEQPQDSYPQPVPHTSHQHDIPPPPPPPLTQRPTYSPYPPENVNSPPIPPALLQIPVIHDPGDGPRVKDVRAFLTSRFATPPSLDDPLCAEFAEEAVLQMLCSVLPEETAMILWYNKSRRGARICPACQRLYRLGDVLPDHLTDDQTRGEREPQTSPYRAREQELSGLCSPVCFILASYNYPEAIRSTWGRVAEELDDATWDLLDGSGQRANDMGLGMLIKMTRCHDLGLGQLFFPELDLDSDSTCHEPESEREEGEGDGKGKEVRKEKVDLVGEMEQLRVGGVEPVAS